MEFTPPMQHSFENAPGYSGETPPYTPRIDSPSDEDAGPSEGVHAVDLDDEDAVYLSVDGNASPPPAHDPSLSPPTEYRRSFLSTLLNRRAPSPSVNSHDNSAERPTSLQAPLSPRISTDTVRAGRPLSAPHLSASIRPISPSPLRAETQDLPSPGIPAGKTLESLGLSLSAITPSLSLARYNQPLCGAILDDRYLLIGTTSSLEFILLQKPSARDLKGKQKEVLRKPIALIKRTRFKQIMILSERSQVLLAIAGRNDHIRVYSLDNIRTLIKRKIRDHGLLDSNPLRDITNLSPPQKARPRASSTPKSTRPLSLQRANDRRSASMAIDRSTGLPRPPTQGTELFARASITADAVEVDNKSSAEISPRLSMQPRMPQRPKEDRDTLSDLAQFLREEAPSVTSPSIASSSPSIPTISRTSSHSSLESSSQQGRLQARSARNVSPSIKDLAIFLSESSPSASTRSLPSTPIPPSSPLLPSSASAHCIEKSYSSPGFSQEARQAQVGTEDMDQIRDLAAFFRDGSIGASTAKRRLPPDPNALQAREAIKVSQDQSALVDFLSAGPVDPPPEESPQLHPSQYIWTYNENTQAYERSLPGEQSPRQRQSPRNGEKPIIPPRESSSPTAAQFHPTGTLIPVAGLNISSPERAGGIGHAHPASGLEYVKLARTKGSRLMKAVETANKTYLAVSCGDSGERIELFTGSKNVSLSLNRTFILPETPRSIELQRQNHDLLDIYLIYDSAVFALEPSSVRVREVGVSRSARRAARRERDRLAREQRSAGSSQASSRDVSPSGTRPIATEEHTETSRMQPSSGSQPAVQAEAENEARNRHSVIRPNNSDPADLATQASTFKSLTAYTTFQQLQHLPSIPTHALSPSHTIPPTYDSVVSSNSTEASNHDLLSPISLLHNITSQQQGPPGLFFMSRGKMMTNIVDGEGKGIMKGPVIWVKEHEEEKTELWRQYVQHRLRHDYFSHIELLTSDLPHASDKMVMLAFGPTEIRACQIGQANFTTDGSTSKVHSESIEVISDEVLRKRTKAFTKFASYMCDDESLLTEVTFMGKIGQHIMFAERYGTNFTIQMISAL